MGRKKKFFDKKKSATFQLHARDSSDPVYEENPDDDRVFVRVDNNPYTLADDSAYPDAVHSVFADAPEDPDGDGNDNCVLGNPVGVQAVNGGPAPLPDHVRKEIIELGFPDDGYNYLLHLREIRNTGGGSAFYQNPKAKLDQLPLDVKAYDASQVHVSEANEDPNEKYVHNVASKSVGVRVKKVLDPEVAALLDDSDLSRFGSDIEDLEEDFVVQANLSKEGTDKPMESDLTNLKINDEGPSCPTTTMGDLKSEDRIENPKVNARHDDMVEKPREHRLLDEQFDLLVGQEYETDEEKYDDYDGKFDDYDSEVADEEEALAEKLKNTLMGNHVMDDMDIDGKYMAPADLLKDNEASKHKEVLESATAVIRRCVEYAEKYENEEDQDLDEFVVQESSDESEKWDCDTIVSTYSNLDNHPGKIQAPEGRRKKKLSESVFGALNSSNNNVIALGGKERLPVDFLPHVKKPSSTQKVKKSVGTLTPDQLKRKQHGQESKEEKKERKSAVKEERREARQTKKEMKGLYNGEAKRAQRVAATSGPSSIHLM